MPSDLASYLPWRISGSYLEACNCEAICPCRRIGGRAGGRSTYGVCLGSLSWQILEGDAGGVDLAGMRTVLANMYDDDEEGSPWSFVLYVDERADERQREALEGIFLGRLGGTPELQFPWVWKPSLLVGVRHVAIEVRDDGCGFTLGDAGDRSFGLQSMHSRAVQLRGRLTITSAPNLGTAIQVEVPTVPNRP